MELLEAQKVADLMKHRDQLLYMRERSISCDKQGWAIKFNDISLSIHVEDKQFFAEAIQNALTNIESQIEKI